MDYSNITAKKFKQMMDVIKEYDDITEMNYMLVSVLLGKEDLTIEEFSQGVKDLEFLNKPYKPQKVKREYIIGDREYYVELNPRKMQANQYIDYQNFIKDPNTNITNIAACFLIPKGKTYGNGYDVLDETEYLDDNLTVDVLQDICFFFQKLYQELTLGTLHSLEREMKKTLKKEKDSLTRRKLMRGMIECRKARKLLLQESGDGFML